MAGASFSIKVISKRTQADFKDIKRRSDRATMWTVRQAGRRVKQEAKRQAPIYKAGGNFSVKGYKAHWAAGGKGRESADTSRPVTGLLRASIGSGKRLRHEGPGAYAVRVAPRGFRVHFYSGQMEARYHYMKDAYDKVAPEAREIAESAWRRSTKK